MNVSITKRLSRDKSKVWYRLEWGKGEGQRRATGIFTYTNPSNKIEKNFNTQQLTILANQRALLTLELNSARNGGPQARTLHENFFDYYEEFVKNNKRAGNRHLENSLTQLRNFHQATDLYPHELNEDYCLAFRKYLLDKYKGETPANYFSRFKQVLHAAWKDGYFDRDIADDVAAKANPSVPKDILHENEYERLFHTPCRNPEVKRAFLFCLYTGLRWVDANVITYAAIDGNTLRFSQNKTGVPVPVPLHPIAKQLAGEGPRDQKIFELPSRNGCNDALEDWMKSCGIEKNITWHGARHSLSVLLQSNGIDASTVAGILGHTNTKQVSKTYRRYVIANGQKAINTLPTF